MTDDFAVFILTHKRPQRVITYKTLRKQGYTGPVYIIIDNEDPTADEYRRIYGDMVIQFDKAAVAQTFDEGDNFNDWRSVIYARNASFQIACDLGLRYFLQLDDDYTDFRFKIDANLQYKNIKINSLDAFFDFMLALFISIPATSIALSQGGDWYQGKDTRFSVYKRKAMNSFFCAVDRLFQFVGRMNDDVNTYLVLGNRGALFLTIYLSALEQQQTQASAGGLTDIYLDYGTYTKSFYSVMYLPSCVRIVPMSGATHKRLHHQISWVNAVPCIISEAHRKAGDVETGGG